LTKNAKPLTLLIRADAYRAIGTGHVMRCMALGQAWKAYGGNVLFASYCESDVLRSRLNEEGFSYIPIQKPYPHPSDLDSITTLLDNLCATEQRDRIIVALDGYHFDGYYQRTIKKKGFRLLFIDDYGHADQYYADVILNQNLSAGTSFYPNYSLYTKFLLGPQYVLLRKEFWKWKTWKRDFPGVAKKVLVTMGGADPDNVTLKVLKALKDLAIPDMEVVVVLGPANPHKDDIEHFLSLFPFKSHLLLSVDNMPELMAWADVAIAAGGSTSWELAFMGLPSLLIILAENQRVVSHKLEESGTSINLGWYDETKVGTIAKVAENTMKNQKVREAMSTKGRSLVDGNGGSEVVKFLRDSYVTFRHVREEDCRLLWEWANDPETRSVSFSTDPISWEHHVRWFTDKLNNPEHVFFILLSIDDEPIGQVRYTVNGREALISMSISPKFRGWGYGSQGIRITVEEFFEHKDIDVIRAHIKPENLKSVKAFTGAGFREDNSAAAGREKGHSLKYFICRDDVI
jgi:UDP-2,4-diacetamido-2,4,6-trideoxy-beta-L-altropyranose hydrolase